MNLLGDHRRDIEAAQRAAEQAVFQLNFDRADADRAIVADLIRTAPDAVRAACERLSSQRPQTHTTPTEQPHEPNHQTTGTRPQVHTREPHLPT